MDHYMYDYQCTTPASIAIYTASKGKQDLKISEFLVSASAVNLASSTTGSNITQ
jgi:hypothetical protein